jgi:metal-responsive CopG/Arc/MetJ family transcriptional regulator
VTLISLKIPADLEVRLRHIATARGLSRSAVIREAAQRYVDQTAGHRDSCLTLASDLIGLVDGPQDLSSNKHRMKGFGT